MTRSAAILRSCYYRLILRSLGIKIGQKVVFWGKLRIGNAPCNISIGNSSSIGHDVFLSTGDDGLLSIGNNVSVNTGCHILAVDKIRIADNVMIGEYVSIRDQDHNFRDAADDLHKTGYITGQVAIQEGAWIGRGSYVGKGVNIGRGAVIGANSVVTHDVKDMTIVAGAPTREIGKRTVIDPHRDKKSTAVVFHHWGPYHLARLQKVAEKVPIMGIEVSAHSTEYKWDAVSEIHENLKRVTLFDNTDSRQLPSTVILKRVKECLDRCKPVCVALPGWSGAHALAALWWCVTNDVPAVCMGDSTAWDWKRFWWKEWQKHRIINAFTTALAAGTATTEYFHQLGMPEDRIFLGYNAVDNVYFQKSAERFRAVEQDLRKELNLNRPFFLVVGRFIPEKNLFHLMDAYMSYRCKFRERANGNTWTGDPWDLVILGDGELRGRLCEHIGLLELVYESCLEGHENSSANEASASVHLRGFVQYYELPKYYAIAECLMLPSRKDTWGLVVNEAMASGLPVLISRCCGCAQDLVEDGGNGFLIDPFNIDDIAEKMLQITRLTESERKAMGRRSQEIIADWGLERFASGLKAAVDKAIEDGPKKITILDKLLLKALTLKP